MAEERLQKILAAAGIASRRKAETYIQEGRVTVNGKLVTELGSKADPARDHIKVDGKLLKRSTEHVYVLMNKPREIVTTVSDPQGRTTVIHILGKAVKERVFPVGRLDYHSEGLLLLTNDGELTNALLHPSRAIEKTYLAKITGHLGIEQQREFARGVSIHGKRTAPARIRLVKEGNNPWYEVVITEGRQHQVRLMFSHFGVLVEKLRRIKFGPLNLKSLPTGAFRFLNEKEVAQLRAAAGIQ